MTNSVTLNTLTMTADDFLARPFTLTPTQLMNGVVVNTPVPQFVHQVLVANVNDILNGLIPHGRLVLGSLDLHLDDLNVFQPDLVWMAKGGNCRVQAGFMRGGPALVVEVLSPETAHYDLHTKFKTYERHGVQEYWIIDPAEVSITIWTRRNAKLVVHGVFGSTEDSIGNKRKGVG